MIENCECGYGIINGLKICENCGREIKPIKLDKLIDNLFINKPMIYGLDQNIQLVSHKIKNQYFNEPKPKTKISMRRL